MKYIVYEIRKLSGVRYIWVFLLILLAANTALCIYTTEQTLNRQMPNDIVADFFDTYTREPERIEAEYKDLLALRDERERLWQDAMRERNFNYEPEPFPNKYIESDMFNDFSLFNEVFNRKNYILSYPSDIQKVIDRAYANIAEFDAMSVSRDSYAYQYQLKVIDLYKDAQGSVRMGLEHTRGWNDYFSYDIVNIFIFAMLVILGSVVFAQEKNSGFLPIIRTSKNGRVKTAFAKVGAMTLVTAAVVLLFTLSTWAVLGMRLGFSNPANAIQVFSEYALSPFVVTVGNYFIITIAVKLFVFILFSTLILMLSVFLYSYAVIYISGFGLFGLNFLLYTLRYINADNPFKNLNFVAVAAVNPLFIRYRSINLFGNVCGYVPFMIAVFAVLICAASAVTVAVFSRGQNSIAAGRFHVVSDALYKFRTAIVSAGEKLLSLLPKKRTYSSSVFLAEIYKTLVSKRYIWIVIGLLLVKGYISVNQFAPVKSYSDSVYKEYMTTLEGELTDEKREYLAVERGYINDVLSREEEMRGKYISEAITYDEYREYLNDYNYAYSRIELFKRIEDHAQYLEQTAAEKNVNAWFVYDTGWKMLYHNGFDIVLYVILLLMFSGVFADEYASKSSSGGFAQILRTTKQGRERTFSSKLASVISVAAILTLICNAVDTTLIYKNYGFTAPDAPVLSLQSFSSANGGITLSQYLVVYIVLKLAGNIMFALFVSGLSGMLKKSIAVMSVAVPVTLFPALFVYFGFDVFRSADFTGLLAATPLYLGGMELLISFIVIAAAIISGTIIYSRRMYVK